MTDKQIFEGIAQKDNKTFLFLYEKYQNSILSMVQKNNGNTADAVDIFQEGVIALWTNITTGKFQVQDTARVSTYLYALCRNIWISRLRQKKDVHSIDDNPQLEIAAEVDEMEEQHNRISNLEQQFQKLDEGCKKILTLFYYKKASMKEIAEATAITEKTAKNQKYRCMQRLKAIYESENLRG